MRGVAVSETRARRDSIRNLIKNSLKTAISAVRQQVKKHIGNTEIRALPVTTLLCCLVAEDSKQKEIKGGVVGGIYRGGSGNSETLKGNATMKHITIIALALALMLCAGCAHAITTTQGEQPTAKYETTFWQVRDVDEPQGAVRIAQEMEAKQAAEEAAAAAAVEQEYSEYYEADYYEPTYYAPSGDGFMQQGVREYNGRTETWYSSNSLYHYRTSEWTVDDEGYYRDDQGRYVVAASDVPEGTEIETSKGTGIVLDSGCDAGVTDFYTAF